MKKVLSLILVLMLLVFSFCSCGNADNNTVTASDIDENISNTTVTAEVSLSDKLITEIEGSYLKASKLPEYSSNAGKVELTEKYTEKWAMVADEYYNKIMEYDDNEPLNNYYKSSEDLHNSVSKMKSSWEQYYQEQSENYLITLKTVYGAGTIVPIAQSRFEYDLQKDWALQIVDIYEKLYPSNSVFAN